LKYLSNTCYIYRLSAIIKEIGEETDAYDAIEGNAFNSYK